MDEYDPEYEEDVVAGDVYCASYAEDLGISWARLSDPDDARLGKEVPEASGAEVGGNCCWKASGKAGLDSGLDIAGYCA